MNHPPLRRVLVFGGRDFERLSVVFEALDLADKKHRIDVIVHGACGLCACGRPGCPFRTLKGADGLADRWAMLRGRGVERHVANWHPLQPGEMPGPRSPLPEVTTKGEHPTPIDRYAGPRRNRQMARSRPAGAIAFPGGAGTQNMLRECQQAGVRVWTPRPSTALAA